MLLYNSKIIHKKFHATIEFRSRASKFKCIPHRITGNHLFSKLIEQFILFQLRKSGLVIFYSLQYLSGTHGVFDFMGFPQWLGLSQISNTFCLCIRQSWYVAHKTLGYFKSLTSRIYKMFKFFTLKMPNYYFFKFWYLIIPIIRFFPLSSESAVQ